jgi:hypothetical protein
MMQHDRKLGKIALSAKLPDYKDLVYVIEKLIFFEESITNMDKIILHDILSRAKISQHLKGK